MGDRIGHKPTLIFVLIMMTLATAAIGLVPTYLQASLHTGFNEALLIAAISNLGFAVTIIPAGMLSDRIGRRTVMVSAAILLLVLSLPLLNLLQAENTATGLIKETGNPAIPAWYVMATALVSIVALMTLNKDDHKRALDEAYRRLSGVAQRSDEAFRLKI